MSMVRGSELYETEDVPSKCSSPLFEFKEPMLEVILDELTTWASKFESTDDFSLVEVLIENILLSDWLEFVSASVAYLDLNTFFPLFSFIFLAPNSIFFTNLCYKIDKLSFSDF